MRSETSTTRQGYARARHRINDMTTSWTNTTKTASTFTNDTKTATTWTNQSPVVTNSFLLLEDGFYLLLEDGYKLILEESVPTGTSWTNSSKS